MQSWVVGSGVPGADDDPDGDDIQRETIGRLLRHYDAGEPDAPNGVEPEGDAYDMPPIVVDAGALDLLPNRVPPQVADHAGTPPSWLDCCNAWARTSTWMMCWPNRGVARAARTR